ncbi:hypothetical protein [Mucilaginibacter sp.]
MKKFLPVFLLAAALYSGCSKDKSVPIVTSKLVTVSVSPNLDATTTSSTWQQIIGGQGSLTIAPYNTDSLSTITADINLTSAASYKQTVVSGTYNITLTTRDTAAVDTFVRFISAAGNVLINKEESIDLEATTNDGVITINTKLIDSTITPTFQLNPTAKYKFSKANGYFFLYVRNNISGVVSFSLSNGYQYMANVTVSAMNQYDLIPIANTYGQSIIKAHPFNLSSSTKIRLN